MTFTFALLLSAASVVNAHGIPPHGPPQWGFPHGPPPFSRPWHPWPTPSPTSSSSLVSVTSTSTSSSVPTSTAPVLSVLNLNQSTPLLDSFMSFSIEFAFFPDYAGNTTHPNTFSNNLLNNLAAYQGSKPYIRVGGNTQDYAIYDPNLPTATSGVFNPAISTDYPLVLNIGPSYFESYSTWPDTKFIHGFNLAANTTEDRELLLDTVPLACKALGGGKLAYWELGNEPDLYKTSAQGIKRPSNWTEQDYVNEWLNGTRQIHDRLQASCPDLATPANYKYYAPSFAGTNNNNFTLRAALLDGQNNDSDIGVLSSHNYISGATSPGVTLQGTLLNFSVTSASIHNHVAEHLSILNITNSSGANTLPYILGEHNSLYNEGRPGLSNPFGAALWGMSFNLLAAASNISRVHLHMGTGYRYQSWQPIDTTNNLYNPTTIGTKAPYYGNIAVAAFIGDVSSGSTRVANIPFPNANSSTTDAAFAVYSHGSSTPARLAVLNMLTYNYTRLANGSGLAYPDARAVKQYTFQLPPACAGTEVGMRRLRANGSDSVTGITWDGWSYNWELDEGRPVRLGNVTIGEKVRVDEGGRVSVGVESSGGVVLDLGCA